MTDSNAQLPRSLVERYRVAVVPLPVVVDGVAYREGVDLDPGQFWRAVRAGAEISTSSPPPGDVLAAYQELAAKGASAILSVHVGANVSATLQAVAVAARSSPVRVEVVDTGSASFGVGCCVWAAGEALARGATLAGAAETARRTAAQVGNVFVVQALDLPRRGGRLAPGVEPGGGLPILALEEGQMRSVGQADDLEAAVEAMVGYVAGYVAGPGGGATLRIGVGEALLEEAGDDLAARLAALPGEPEVVRYQVGPSVGAHTGPGTLGAVFAPWAPAPTTHTGPTSAPSGLTPP
ncbi:MAG: DegV family protein [Acidimicrobiales bacterium]